MIIKAALLSALLVWLANFLTKSDAGHNLANFQASKTSLANTFAGWLADFGLYSLAEQLYQSSFDANPKDIQPLIEIASLEQRQGLNDRAITDLQKLLVKGGGNAAIYDGLGKAYVGLCRNDLALNYFSQAIATSPQQPKAWYDRAGLYLSMRNYGAALQDLEVPIAVHYGPAYFRRIEIYRLVGRNDLAERDQQSIKRFNLSDSPAGR